MDADKRELTRYLCAAVQTDERFCDQIVEEILNEEHQAIGIAYGIDLPTVLKSCLISQRRKIRRDALLSIISLLSLLSLISGVHFPVLISLYLVAWLIVFQEEKTSRYEIIAKYALKSNFKPEFFESLRVEPSIENRLKVIGEEQSGNAIIYGGFSPFVGSGVNVGGWSFVIDIGKGKEDIGGQLLKVSPFQVSEMYKYITDSILKLGLSNLKIRDNLYVNGEEIRDDLLFLSHPLAHPSTQVSPVTVKKFIENPTHTVRHYRCFRVTDWQGELALSGFIRLVIVEQSLFIEVNYCLLTPLSNYYRQFDAIQLPKARELWDLAKKTFWKTVFILLAAPSKLIEKQSSSWQKRRQRKRKQREILENPLFNYGAAASLRERVSQSEYRRYFQKLDQEMYAKIIERRIIDSITSFLSNKNVDVSDLKETRSTILNNGVIVSGGSVAANNIAVGNQATANNTTVGGQMKSILNLSQLGNAPKAD